MTPGAEHSYPHQSSMVVALDFRSIYVGIYGYKSLYGHIYGHRGTYLKVFGHIWTYKDVCLVICLDFHRNNVRVW